MISWQCLFLGHIGPKNITIIKENSSLPIKLHNSHKNTYNISRAVLVYLSYLSNF